METLRKKVKDKTKAEILAIPEFKAIHDEYVKSVADAVGTLPAALRPCRVPLLTSSC